MVAVPIFSFRTNAQFNKKPAGSLLGDTPERAVRHQADSGFQAKKYKKPRSNLCPDSTSGLNRSGVGTAPLHQAIASYREFIRNT